MHKDLYSCIVSMALSGNKSPDDFVSSYDSDEVRAGTVVCDHLQQKTLP